MIPPEVPSEENFAHTPLLKPLYDVEWNVDFTKVIEERDLEGRQRTGQFLKRLRLSDKAKEQYGNKSWIGGEAVDLEAWQQSFRDHEEWPNPVTRGDPAEDILLALKKYDSGLVELENAVRDRPFSRFGIEYRAHFFGSYSHSSVLIRSTRAYQLRACLLLQQNLKPQALKDIETGLLIALSIHDEPMAISVSLQGGMVEALLQPVWEGLKREAWSAEELKLLLQQFEALDFLQRLELGLKGERLFTNEFLERPNLKEQLLEDFGGGEFIHDSVQVWIDFLLKSQQYLPELNMVYFEIQQKALSVEKQRIFVGTLENPKAVVLNPSKELEKLLLSGLGVSLFQEVARIHNYLQMARIACLLELHKLEKGSYPETLDEMSLDLPHDCLTGESFLYRQTGDGRYQLYSLGWNERDDRGRVSKDRKGPDGDWVWQYTKVPVLEE